MNPCLSSALVGRPVLFGDGELCAARVQIGLLLGQLSPSGPANRVAPAVARHGHFAFANQRELDVAADPGLDDGLIAGLQRAR
jgi:hypothetical protein